MREKAIADAVELTEQPDDSFFTRSAKTRPGRFYLTTADTCSCPATAHCKHIAAVRAELAKRVCRRCGGTGTIPYRRFNPYASEHEFVRCTCRPAPTDLWKYVMAL